MTTYTHQTAPTQFVEANGIRFAYRRFGNHRGVPLVFNSHFRGTMDYWDPASSCVMLSSGAELYLVRAETSSLDAVSAALHAETAEVAAGRNLRRHSHSYSHSRRRTRRPALVFGRAVVVRHFPCRRHKTSPN
jgi:hypothetical protein